MNAYAKFESAILTALFDIDKEDPSALEYLPVSIRFIAEFLEHNDKRMSPSTFETYEAFKGAYRQWNIMREKQIDRAHNEKRSDAVELDRR